MKFVLVLGCLCNSNPLTSRNLQLENLDSWKSPPQLGALTFPPKEPLTRGNWSPLWGVTPRLSFHTLFLRTGTVLAFQWGWAHRRTSSNTELLLHFRFQFGTPGKHCGGSTDVPANHKHLESLAEWVRIRSRGTMISSYLQWQEPLIQAWQTPHPAPTCQATFLGRGWPVLL